jgi:hypothetical protein
MATMEDGGPTGRIRLYPWLPVRTLMPGGVVSNVSGKRHRLCPRRGLIYSRLRAAVRTHTRPHRGARAGYGNNWHIRQQETQYPALSLNLSPTYCGDLSTAEVQRCIVGVSVVWCLLHVPLVRCGKGDVIMQIEKPTALEAYRAGKLYLPPGYELLYGADVLLLRRNGGSVVATFSARAATPSELARIAEKDYRANGKSSA